MTSNGEIPGGCNRLKHLLYPFHDSYPLKLWSKYRWWKNGNLKHKLSFLNKSKSWLTVIDRLGAPGDALITANVIRCIKNRYSHLKINCITPHPELIRLDPSIDSINCKRKLLFLRFHLLGTDCSQREKGKYHSSQPRPNWY